MQVPREKLVVLAFVKTFVLSCFGTLTLLFIYNVGMQYANNFYV